MLLETIKSKFLDGILSTEKFRGDSVVIVRPEAILDLMGYLKSDPDLNFKMLVDLSAVDYQWQQREPRFDVVYHLFSLRTKQRLRVKVGVTEKNPELDSVVSLWPVADWFEREVWDMFGIGFKGHPNLKRILMYDGFEGHPLRKDFPITKRQPLIDQKSDQELARDYEDA